MRPWLHMRRLAFACLLAVSASLLGQIGCTDQACIQWAESEGPCPPMSEAIKYMVPSSDCTGQSGVISVDSEGDFDGQACCYDVTKRDDDEPIACGTSVGVGVGPGATTAVTTGTGATGGGPTCEGASCSPECFFSTPPPSPPPSMSSCVVIDNITIHCNPLTNEGCENTGGSCDVFFDGVGFGTTCWPTTLFSSWCSSCFSFGECASGLGCVGSCAQFCCDDADCTPGVCFKDQYANMELPMGVCVDASFASGGAGGMGGAGGAGGAGGMGGI
jgi:hypothetical protein